MSNFSNGNDNGMNEARSIIGQKTADELMKLMSSDDELAKLIGNLGEVGSFD